MLHKSIVVGTALALLAIASAQTERPIGTWKTWVITPGKEFRLPAPPDKTASQTEVQQLEALAKTRDAAALERIRYWDSGSPNYRWNELAVQQALKNGMGANRAARMLSLVHVAIFDAMVVAWDNKYQHFRPRPSQLQRSFKTALPNPSSPAYPSEHAVAAGAASAVLAALFPNDAAVFQAKAEEAGRSRLLAGTDYPSDVTAGLELGRKVAAKVLERAKADGSDAKWNGSVPTEKGKWTGSNPVEPLGGTWRTWALGAGNQFRPGPPPAFDSAQMGKELLEIKEFKRTNLTNITASYWEYYGGRAYFDLYTQLLGQKLFEYHLDRSPPRAAQAYATQAVAFHDLFVAAWDTKYTYWQIRPFQLDPGVTPVFTTPNHPSYPAAHATIAGAMETVMGALFPADAAFFGKQADDESWSRLWAGIHFRSDIEAGRALGRKVGNVVLERAGQGSLQ